MDSEELAEAIRIAHVTGMIQLAVLVAVVYYYVLSTDDEVKWIWPQPRFKVGRVLFFCARYTAWISFFCSPIYNLPLGSNLNTTGCNVFMWADNGSRAVTGVATEGIFWLCLSAMLGAGRASLVALAIVFTCILVPVHTFQLVSRGLEGRTAIERIDLDAYIGYPCTWGWQATSPYFPAVNKLRIIARYLVIAKSIVMMLLAIYAVTAIYRRSRSRLIHTIKREGGFYYLTKIAFDLAWLVLNDPNSKVKDKYRVVGLVRYLPQVVFADRLILNLQRSQDPGTQAFVSSLVFDKDRESENATATERTCTSAVTAEGRQESHEQNLEIEKAIV